MTDPLIITNPEGDNETVGLSFDIRLEFSGGQSPYNWSLDVNGGGFNPIAGPTSDLFYVYTTPDHVTNKVSGSDLFDKLTLKVTDSSCPSLEDTVVLLLVNKPKINHSNRMGDPTDGTSDTNVTPVENRHTEGTTDEANTSGDPEDEENQSEHVCDSVNCTYCSSEGSSCCTCPKHDGKTGGEEVTQSYSAMTNSGGSGERKREMYCPESNVAGSSEIYSNPNGILKVEESWGSLFSRGMTIDLGFYYTNVPDGFSGSRPAGVRGDFGWFAAVVANLTSGDLALYWGGRGVEPWIYNTGNRINAGGTFGQLKGLKEGPWTRIGKNSMYYDFDSNGKLQTIKDRSQDGNIVYFNYVGSNMVRITGPGLGYQPYFTYDGSSRVTLMSMESGDPAENRLTYYRYDASGRMLAIHGPVNAITYLQYDTNHNLIKKTNADAYVTYFDYEGSLPFRIQQIKMSEGATLYYS